MRIVALKNHVLRTPNLEVPAIVDYLHFYLEIPVGSGIWKVSAIGS